MTDTSTAAAAVRASLDASARRARAAADAAPSDRALAASARVAAAAADWADRAQDADLLIGPATYRMRTARMAHEREPEDDSAAAAYAAASAHLRSLADSLGCPEGYPGTRCPFCGTWFDPDWERAGFCPGCGAT